MREKIRMNSTAGTGHFYTTDKNKRTMPDKLEMKKYDPVARKHVSGPEPGFLFSGPALPLTGLLLGGVVR